MKHKKLIICIVAMLSILSMFFILIIGRIVNPYYTLQLEMNIKTRQNIQVSYTVVEEVSVDTLVFKNFDQVGGDGSTKIKLNVPKDIHKLRIDFGDGAREEVVVNSVKLGVMNESLDISKAMVEPMLLNNVTTTGDKAFVINDIDPYVVLEINQEETTNFWESTIATRIGFGVLVALIFDAIVILCTWLMLKNKETMALIENRRTIWNLSKRDFKTKYAGSYLGIFWAFVQPIVTILIYWFVFEVGFRSAPANGFPFVLWLISGIVPWFMFSDGLNAVTNCLLEYSYLVKKVVFDIKMLPIVKIISALFVHLFFIGFTIFIFALNGYGVSIYMFQIFYYLVAIIALVFAIGLITCSIIVFFRDLGQIVQICLQIGVWLTPIMWNLSMLSPKLQFLFKFNPTYYIVEGYRDCFINHIWFWEKPELTIYYWCVVAILLWIGSKVFKSLRSHYADVL